MVFLLCQAVLDVGESGVDRTGFSPLCRNSFNIGVFFSDIMKQYVSYSFYVYFNKGQKTGMEGGEGWGMLMKSIHFLSTRFICLNKNSILVCFFFRTMEKRLYFYFYFQFYRSDNFKRMHWRATFKLLWDSYVFGYGRYGFWRKSELLNCWNSIIVFLITEACVFNF